MTNTLTIGEKIARDLCEMDPPAGDSIEVDPVDVARRIDDFASTLAAQIELMRKAIEAMKHDSDECLDFDECTAMLVPIDSYHQLIESAITTPDQALEQFAERVREQCAQVCNSADKSTHPADLADAIKELP